MSKITGFLSFFSLRKLLNNRKFTIPFSLVMAFLIWLVIVINENPIIERSFADMTVSINLENTIASENGMSMVGNISDQKFTVIARGPTYLISSLKNEDFNVYASVASVDAPGEYTLDVVATPNATNKGYEVLKVVPSTVKVSFDYIDTKEFTVKAMAEGVTAKNGLIAENSVVSGAESDTITITGPRAVISKIDSVVAYTKVNKTLAVSETFDATIKLYDAKGKELELDNLTLSETTIKVTVPISKKKTVPVEVDFLNMPEGFEKSSLKYTIDHEKVTIIGKPEAVDKIKKITLSPIEMFKITKNTNKFDVSAQLPEGVRSLDNIEHFKVEFNLSNYTTRTVDVSEFKFKNLGNNLTAGGDKIKNITITGTWNDIYSFNNNQIYAVVDLADKKAGQHTVQVLICFKNNKKVWAIGSYDATVTIKKK